MLRGVAHLAGRMSGGLALDPGMRKTSITLAAFCELQRAKQARNMLVIAPLRVCRTVWRQEGAKWTQFRHLRFALLHGSKKNDALKAALAGDADICLVNPEGVAWLCSKFFGRSLPFDVVTIDELTKFKNASTDRSKRLRKHLSRVRRRWGLTGSLAPNGYEDLFGQMLVLDDGAALGKYITHYRSTYFQLGYDGVSYELLPGAERRIIERIAPYWLQLSADDYLSLPPLVDAPLFVELDTEQRALYNKMKRDMVAEFKEGVVTASNAGAVYSKLSQMANGAVYVNDAHDVAHVHDAKLDALEDLLEELQGKPLLLAYEFNSDLDRLRARFGDDLPHLGKGTTATQEASYIAAWNRGELPLLACHPASAGHGLNLQEGNAAHVCWFGLTWDLELWDQFIRRVRRSGNAAQRIFNHVIIARGTIDELKLQALADKDTTQKRLLSCLNAEILREYAETPSAGEAAQYEDRSDDMVTKLSRGPQPAPQVQGERIQPKGWGKPAQMDVEEVTGGAAHPDQRQAIQEKITQPASPAEQARAAFSPAVQQHMKELSGETAAPAEKAPKAAKAAGDAVGNAVTQAALIRARAEVLSVAFNDPSTNIDDGLEIARELMDFVLNG